MSAGMTTYEVHSRKELRDDGPGFIGRQARPVEAVAEPACPTSQCRILGIIRLKDRRPFRYARVRTEPVMDADEMPKRLEPSVNPVHVLARQISLWAALGAVVVLWVVLAVQTQGGWRALFAGLCVAQAAALAAAIHLGVGGDPAGNLIKSLDIELEAGDVALGSTFGAVLEVVPRRTFTARQVCAFVECAEVATNRVAGYATQDRKLVYYRETPVAEDVRFVSGQFERYKIRFDIPSDGMHSFACGHFEVRWRVGLDMDIPGRFDLVVARRITVVPELAPKSKND